MHVEPGVAARARRAVTDHDHRRGTIGGRANDVELSADPRFARRASLMSNATPTSLVVGSGAAGMSAALTAAGHGRRVLLVTKEGLGGGSTPLAQGGLAAAIGPGDGAPLHLRDTLHAGAGLCDPAAVATLVAEAPGEIAALTALGARFDVTALHLEGGHTRRRIVHAGGDAAGAEVHRTLRAALLASPVQVLTRAVALDALTDEQGSVRGLLVGVASAGRPAGHRDGAGPRRGPGHRRFRPGVRHHHQPARGDRRRPGAGCPRRGGCCATSSSCSSIPPCCGRRRRTASAR